MRAPALDHLLAMTDDVGLFQHSRRGIPSRAHGYCIDDIGRALIVACEAAVDPATATVGTRLISTYLGFVADANQHDGWFHNFMGYDRRWQDERGTEDSFGRALWGLGYASAHAVRPSWRGLASELLHRGLPHVADLQYLRARAYAALGLARVLTVDPSDDASRAALQSALAAIADAYRAVATPDWRWCEEALTYDNARLCEALLRGGIVLDDPEFTRVGCEMLDFYAGVVIEDGMLVPIGNVGWYVRGGARSRFGQQPLEAAAVVDAGLVAFALTGEDRYRSLARAGYDWFFGGNVHGAMLIANGGCGDGIERDGASENMGAESTLAYLMSAYAMVRAERER